MKTNKVVIGNQTYGEWMRSNPEQPTSPLINKIQELKTKQ
jgi:hypothetical protein